MAPTQEQLNSEKTRVLSDAYYDPRTGFVNAEALYKKVKKSGVSRAQVKEFMSQQEVVQLHKRRRKKVYYPITAGGPHSFQADLTFYDQYQKQNKGFNCVLVFINIHTRKVYAEAVKGKKTGPETFDVESSVLSATKRILSRIDKISNLTTDGGGEFTNERFRRMMNDNDINLTIVPKDNKNSMGKVERFNRTLRGRLQKYFTALNTVEWIDVLQDFIDNYNDTYHRSIKTTPNMSREEDVIMEEYERVQEVDKLVENFKEGDKVRVMKIRQKFEKTGEVYENGIFTVLKVHDMGYTLQRPDGSVMRRHVPHYQLEKVSSSVSAPNKKEGKNAIKSAKKDSKIDRVIKKAGIERHPEPGAPRPQRTKKPNTKYLM